MSLLARRLGLTSSGFTAGGGGTVDEPDSISGLTLWLDASTLTLNNGDIIGTWPDQSANGYDATGTGTNRPLYRPTGCSGQPAAEFDGINDFFSLSMSEPAGDWTWFFVFEGDDAGGTPGNLRYLYDAASGRLILAQLADNTNDDAPGYYDGSWKVSTTTASTGAQVLEFNLSSTGGGKIYRNQTQLLSTTYTQRALGGSQRIGSVNNDSSNCFDGRMGEIICYNSALGSTDRSTIYTYINDKYGL